MFTTPFIICQTNLFNEAINVIDYNNLHIADVARSDLTQYIDYVANYNLNIYIRLSFINTTLF